MSGVGPGLLLDFAEADLRQRVFKEGVPGEPGKVVGELKREEGEVMQGRSASGGPDSAQTQVSSDGQSHLRLSFWR